MLDQPVSSVTPLLTWVGLAAFIVLALVMGWLIPWRVHREIVKDRDIWRETALSEGEARRESEQQVHELLEVTKMTYALVVAIQKVTGVNPTPVPQIVPSIVSEEG